MNNLEGFSEWLRRRGRDPGTAKLYVTDVRLALRDGPIERLLDDGLAPKTKRHILAALRSWASYTKDADLLLQLKDLKLPPPERVTDKKPLDEDEWFSLIDQIESDKNIDETMGAILLLMAIRGFRCGDVLRLERKQVRSAVDDGALVFRAKGGRMVRFAASEEKFHAALEVLAGKTGSWKHVDELVCPSAEPETRRKSANQKVNRALRRAAGAVGLTAADIYSHRLRRTYAVHFLRAMKGDPEALQKLQAQMQWANPNTLFEYTDYVREEALAAVEQRMWGRRRS